MENLVNLNFLSSFYKGKKVFVTGHTGFKGSWLIASLHLLGAQIKGYALPPEYEGLFNVLEPLNFVDSVFKDIRDKKQLEHEIEEFKPDVIFHLAAQPLVRRSYKIPSETFEVNVVGTANLLEAVNNLTNKCTVIVVTTDKVYENKELHILYQEEDKLGGYDPYSASKACAELVINSFRNSFFNLCSYTKHQKALASARAGNVIGGGDWSEDRIIPDIVKALKLQRPVEVRKPKSVRPWQHVLEPIGGYLLLAQMLDKNTQSFSKAYNFGPLPGDHLKVKEIVEIAIKTWGNGSWKDCSSLANVHEAGLLQLSIEKAKHELKWYPKLDAKTAMEWTMDWYKQPVEKLAGYTFQQIADYFKI